MTELTNKNAPTPSLSDATPDSTLNLSGSAMGFRTTAKTPEQYFFDFHYTGHYFIYGTPQIGGLEPRLSIKNAPIYKTPHGTTSDAYNIAEFNDYVYDNNIVMFHANPTVFDAPEPELTESLFRGMVVVQEHKGDIVSQISQLFRYSFGGFDYLFFTVAMFTDQGMEEIARVDGFNFPHCFQPSVDGTFLRSQNGAILPPEVSAANILSHGALFSDLSNQKHACTSIPYKRNLRFRDHCVESSAVSDRPFVDPEQYLTIRPVGTWLAGNDQEIQQRLLRRPRQDFRLMGPLFSFIINWGAPESIPVAEFPFDLKSTPFLIGDHTLAPSTWQYLWMGEYRARYSELVDPYLGVYPTEFVKIPKGPDDAQTIKKQLAWHLRDEAPLYADHVEINWKQAVEFLKSRRENALLEMEQKKKARKTTLPRPPPLIRIQPPFHKAP